MQAERVWIEESTDDVFCLVEVLPTDDEPTDTVATTVGNVPRAKCLPANPDGYSAPDNCQLIHINEASVLHNLHLRFASKHIYTYVGSILIALNPFELLPIYGTDKMAAFAGRLPGLVPHVYAIADAAFRAFLKTGASQSLVVSGESGAGKVRSRASNLGLSSLSTGRSERSALLRSSTDRDEQAFDAVHRVALRRLQGRGRGGRRPGGGGAASQPGAGGMLGLGFETPASTD